MSTSARRLRVPKRWWPTRSGENFPVALRVLPERYRRHLTNLYFFARLTDDLGDEAREVTGPGRPTPARPTAGYRLRLLDELAADVDRIYQGATPRIAGHARHGGDRARVRCPGRSRCST